MGHLLLSLAGHLISWPACFSSLGWYEKMRALLRVVTGCLPQPACLCNQHQFSPRAMVPCMVVRTAWLVCTCTGLCHRTREGLGLSDGEASVSFLAFRQHLAFSSSSLHLCCLLGGRFSPGAAVPVCVCLKTSLGMCSNCEWFVEGFCLSTSCMSASHSWCHVADLMPHGARSADLLLAESMGLLCSLERPGHSFCLWHSTLLVAAFGAVCCWVASMYL
jgi:hypothetical protein